MNYFLLVFKTSFFIHRFTASDYDQSKHGLCWPLHKDVLERIVVHYRDLIDLIDTRRGVVDDMLAVRCISQSHAQYIKSASNSEQQNRRLLEVLCRRSQSDFDAAVACWCNKQSVICPLLQQTAGMLTVGSCVFVAIELLYNEISSC
jgi:arginine/ornithine N-succinyltransferase beta subunit